MCKEHAAMDWGRVLDLSSGAEMPRPVAWGSRYAACSMHCGKNGER